MPETLPAGMRVTRTDDPTPGKVVAATDPNDAPPQDGQQYVRVKWEGTHTGVPTFKWERVADLEPVTP